MGNKPSSLDLKYDHLYPSQGRNLKKNTSEEDYLPMSWKMRKSVLEKNKFRHFVPQKGILETVEAGDTSVETSGKSALIEEHKDSENLINEVSFDTSNYKVEGKDIKSQVDDIINTLQSADKSNKLVEPIVTVLNVSTITDSRSQLDIPQENISSLKNQSFALKEYTPCQKSPNPTNKRYSLVNVGTGLTKSKFTLELEDKLRQSKFDLGFDADINDWKEFTYRMESPDFRKKSEGITKITLLGEENCVGRGLEKVYLKDPLQYCNHDCQILGLCSVRPNIFQKKETIKESNIDNETQSNMVDASNYSDGDKETHKKDTCNCQHCTLAFLTEMKFPEHENKNLVTVKRSRNHSLETMNSRRSSNKRRTKLPSNRSNHTIKSQVRSNRERIRISQIGEHHKSIEVSVKDRSEICSTINSLFSDCDTVISQSNLSSVSSGDCTNKRIREIFNNNKNKSPIRGGIPDKTTYDEIPFLNHRLEEKPSTHVSNLSPERTIQVQTADLRQTGVFNKHKVYRKSSGSTVGVSVTSSLSTIMSYKRVRQIFQSIIEKNRIRKRPRKNINKFKEMEDLGLGKVKNNRWYPSDSKTYRIWSDLNQSVGGVQAEFKKYPKASAKEVSRYR